MDILDAANALLVGSAEAGAAVLATWLLVLAALAFAAFPASRKVKVLFLLAVLNEARGLVTIAGFAWASLR